METSRRDEQRPPKTRLGSAGRLTNMPTLHSPTRDTRARGSARATEQRPASGLAASWAAPQAMIVRSEGRAGGIARARDARATRGAGSRGAPLARRARSHSFSRGDASGVTRRGWAVRLAKTRATREGGSRGAAVALDRSAECAARGVQRA